MHDRWDDFGDAEQRPESDLSPRPGHRRSRRRGRRPRRRELSPEERAYRVARRRANAKLAFLTHFVSYLAVCTFLLLVAGFRPAFITALGWGIGLVIHYFSALVAPGLRDRFIQSEVRREVRANVTRERQSIEDRHARSLEQLSAAIAHEIRNPITAAKSLVQQMGEDPTSQDSLTYANVALEELDRVERSISHLLRYAREEELDMSEVRLADVVDSALESFRDRLTRTGVVLEREVDSNSVMLGDPEKLRRILINLVGNALDALVTTGTPDPHIHVMVGENLAGTEVWARVRDNGPGIDADTLHKIFSPFYTSKENGTGLGLAISKKLVDAHGGSIEATSTPGAGAEFVLTFPKRSDPTSARGADPSADPSGQGA
jgi:signal transduction histidine kinase